MSNKSLSGLKYDWFIQQVNILTKSNISKAEIARRLHILPQSLNNIIQKQRNITDDFIDKFIQTFNLQAEFLLPEKTVTYKSFLDSMHELRELAQRVYPDKYKLVCMQEGITESSAMDMYNYFMKITEGHIPYYRSKPLADEQIAKIIDLAIKADGMYSEAGRKIDVVKLNTCSWRDSLNMAMIVWTPKDSDEKQYTEMDLSCQDTYVTIGRMVDNGNIIHAIIRQSDRIDQTSACMSFSYEERGRKGFNVFDGDVILAYVEKPDFWSSDARDSGLYLCSGGAYRRLLYTPGKGYVRKGRADIDDELEIQIQEGAFNSHVLTISQKWKRIGNVHVDIGFLIENPKEEA